MLAQRRLASGVYHYIATRWWSSCPAERRRNTQMPDTDNDQPTDPAVTEPNETPASVVVEPEPPVTLEELVVDMDAKFTAVQQRLDELDSRANAAVAVLQLVLARLTDRQQPGR
jgi:hypothetical protein